MSTMDDIFSKLADKKTHDEAAAALKALGAVAFEPLIEAARGKDRKLKAAAVKLIRDINEPLVPELLVWAEKPDKADRIHAMKMMGEIASDDDRLLECLDRHIRSDQYSLVGKAAFDALIKKGDKAVPYLTGAVGYFLRRYYFIDHKAIFEMFGERLLPEIYKILEREGPQNGPFQMEIMFSSDWELNAPFRLLHFFGPSILPPLLRWMERKYHREIVVAAAIAGMDCDLYPPAQNVVTQMVPHRRDALRSAIALVAHYGLKQDGQARIQMVRELLRSEDFHEGMAGLLLAGASKCADLIEPVAGYLNRNEYLRIVAILALSRMVATAEQIPAAMLGLLDHPNPKVAEAAVCSFRLMAANGVKIPKAAQIVAHK